MGGSGLFRSRGPAKKPHPEAASDGLGFEFSGGGFTLE